MSAEAVLAAVYAGMLTLIAFSIEWLSAHTHRRALRYRTAGFTYNPDHDHWLCPTGEQLWPHEFDRELRLVRYRARPAVCNVCHLKESCTDSNDGREIVRPLDPWPHSEAGRFHRVITLMLVVLALLVLMAALARNHDPAEVGVLVGLAALTLLAARWLARDLRSYPARFPAHSPSHGLRLGDVERR
jgi:hypothetical protein